MLIGLELTKSFDVLTLVSNLSLISLRKSDKVEEYMYSLDLIRNKNNVYIITEFRNLSGLTTTPRCLSNITDNP